MTILDLIECSIMDARPSTLPDRAPRCLEDELLPDAEPLPMPNVYYGDRSAETRKKYREATKANAAAAMDRLRAEEEERIKARRRKSPHAPDKCGVCGRPSFSGDRCWRLLCRT